jgi:hypothetical protein
MTAPIDFDRFVVHAQPPAAPEITIAVLKSPFRVAPIGEEAEMDFYVCNRTDGWYLVEPELAECGQLQGLYLAKLYPAMRADGGLSLIPVTYPNPGFSGTWFEAWKEIIPVARQKWIKLTSNKLLGRHEYETVTGMPKPVWPDLPYPEWVAHAFGDRVMCLESSGPTVEMPKRRSPLPGSVSRL